MEVTLPLSEMTTADKLRTIESIWDDLLRTRADIPSPAWHADILCARENRVREGKATFGDWTEAKRRIRDSAR